MPFNLAPRGTKCSFMIKHFSAQIGKLVLSVALQIMHIGLQLLKEMHEDQILYISPAKIIKFDKFKFFQ
jgi:hypothetical protein